MYSRLARLYQNNKEYKNNLLLNHTYLHIPRDSFFRIKTIRIVFWILTFTIFCRKQDSVNYTQTNLKILFSFVSALTFAYL